MRVSRFNLALGGIAAFALLTAALFLAVPPGNNGDFDGNRLVKAMAQYVQERERRGEPLPSTITLDELIRSGFLRPADAKAFGGADLVFHSNADETNPSSILVEARMPDGIVLAVLGDGSVQALSPQRLKNQNLHPAPVQEPTPAGRRQPSGTP